MLHSSLPSLRRALLLELLLGFILTSALTQPIEQLAHDAGLEHGPHAALFSQARAVGVLYPRWVQTLHGGLGGQLFTFQAPLPYYALDGLWRLGVPHPLGWRLLVATFLLVGAGGLPSGARPYPKPPGGHRRGGCFCICPLHQPQPV